LHGLLNKNNKNPGEKINSDPHPLARGGGDFLGFFLENIIRRSVRVLKLHRRFILTKKEI
jgi:hypothetical protein